MNLATTQYSLSTKTFEIYVSGCVKHPCKGCYSQELWDEKFGVELDDDIYKGLMYKIENNLDMIDNIMICGGEILEKPKEEIIKLIKFLQQYKKPIWLYTRFKYEEVDKEILNELDYIKCGQYDETKVTDKNIQFGIKLASSNQKIYKISGKYKLILNKFLKMEVNNMARRDGTGPEGKGPNTGRGRGPCNTTKKKVVKRGIKNGKTRK